MVAPAGEREFFSGFIQEFTARFVQLAVEFYLFGSHLAVEFCVFFFESFVLECADFGDFLAEFCGMAVGGFGLAGGCDNQRICSAILVPDFPVTQLHGRVQYMPPSVAFAGYTPLESCTTSVSPLF